MSATIDEECKTMTRSHRTIAQLASVATLVVAAFGARATDFSFQQSGFAGGGAVTGSFSGSDLDGNGQISSFSGEVTAFSLTFTGDALVGSFNHQIRDLFGLVYNVGSGTIGDGTSPILGGLASNWNVGTGYDYASGLGPLEVLGGRVLDTSTGIISQTDQLIFVSVVPEPATLLMLLAGIALVLRRTRNDA